MAEPSPLAAAALGAVEALLAGMQRAAARSSDFRARLDASLALDADALSRELLLTALRIVIASRAAERGLLPAAGPSLLAVHQRLRGSEPNAGPMSEAWTHVMTCLGPSSRGTFPSTAAEPLLADAPLDVAAVCGLLDPLLAPDIARYPIGDAYEGLIGHRLVRVSALAVAVPFGPGGARVWLSPERLRGLSRERCAQVLMAEFGLTRPAAERLRREHERVQSRADRVTVEPGGLVLQPTGRRRASGVHYTPPEVIEQVVRATLSPLLEDCGSSAERLLGLTVCDPAMGAGAFLLEVVEQLGAALAESWAGPGALTGALTARARREIAVRCVYGVDRDPIAVGLARASLWLHAAAPGDPLTLFDPHLRVGDSTVGTAPGELDVSHEAAALTEVFHWPREFGEVFEGGGFAAIVGNPPWIAYAGRAAQPLAPELRRYYLANNPAFAGYRSLHGVFIRRAATLLRPGGRLGLVLPTSVADLANYGPTRAAHDELCVPDEELPDFGDGVFEGVFQPCMALLSTRRVEATARARCSPAWSLTRSDLGPVAARLLARLAALPSLDPTSFAERGYQTSAADAAALSRVEQDPFVTPLHEGTDVGEFQTRPARVFANPDALTGRLRPAAQWRQVQLFVRQTARYPIVGLADGRPFRNSILAGFARGPWSAPALVCYLNSSVVRWYHFQRHRDARQGMPQVKIGHLRSLPEPAFGADAREELDRMGYELCSGNRGISALQRARLDELVARGFELEPAELALVRSWAAEHPPPRSRAD